MLNQWREIAWNGIRFQTPAAWQLAQIGVRHLVLEDEAMPVMEVKWARIKGKFSHTAHLKRLASLQKKQIRKTLRQTPLSPEWESVLTDFSASAFSWQVNSTQGRGVILFCPSCATATLIQFFQKDATQRTSVSQEILHSFQDHRSDSQILWCAYDIRAIVPQSFQLKRHRFEAGRFELEFTDGRQHICLHRWALASVLLAEQDLVQFARTVAGFHKAQAVPGNMAGWDTAECSISPTAAWQRWLSRFKRSASYFWLGLWHLAEKNRILGVRAEAKKPLDGQLLNSICAHYESI